MGRNGAAPDGRQRTEELLESLLGNGRRAQLCAEVAAIRGAPRELVEDALQDVCERADKCRGTSEAEVYKWLHTATLRRTNKLLGLAYRRHEVLVDPDDEQLERAPIEPQAANNGADVAVLERERERELAELLRPAVEQLSERQRQVAALHSRGAPGREMARHLGTSERRVKHLKAETYGLLRETLLEGAGGGCQEGERLVGRFSFGLASAGERAATHLHLSSCARCMTLYQRLELMHEKVAALLPVPAAAQADPGLVERTLHKTTQVLAHVKQQLADAAGQAKQHAAAGYGRAVEYTPLAGARPGAAATAIAGCLALGGGAATYCLDRAGVVDPFGAFGRDRPADVREPPAKKSPAEQPPDPPQVPAAAPAPPPPTPAPTPEPTTPAPAPAAPAPAPAPPPPPPPPPAEPTPPAVQFGEPTNPTPAAPAQSAPPEPAPAPSDGADLYGP